MNTRLSSVPGWYVSSDANTALTLEERVIQALGQIVRSRSGCLWEETPEGVLFPRSRYGIPAMELPVVESSDPLIRYMVRREWIINLGDPVPEPPDWLSDCPDAWLLIPLLLPENRLRGLVLLTHAADIVPWNRDTIERLKTSSRLAASYLALEDADRALTIARQFESLHRISGFVVHDLRNLLAQLSLLLGNARQHRHQKRFGEEALLTLDHVVRRMNRLIAQMRQPLHPDDQPPGCADVDGLIRQAIEHRVMPWPRPVYCASPVPIPVQACAERLSTALGHILRNAQEAAGPAGRVNIRCRQTGPAQVTVSIEDNGPGMTDTFIRTRLFTPFATTKGTAGLGIGVCQSRDYLRVMGGDLRVESTPGQGSVFHLLIPAPAVNAYPAHGVEVRAA